MTGRPCINPSLVRQYLFCPAAAYYIIAGLAEPPTERMRRGREVQREAVEAAARALGAEDVRYSVELRGAGFCGVVDAVLTINGRPAPLEVKTSPRPRRVPTPHKAQVAAYMLAAQAQYGRAVQRGYVYYAESGDVVEIRLTRDLRDLVLHVAGRIRQIYAGYTPQPAVHPSKCPGCWYRKWCADISRAIDII
ncbi:MAG: CRISPR-associated protein Cas4 [Thermoproteaceae archaeon]|nr:CRISPR-associated protein Cas4 [Thermoproteaceae archaeon]